MTRLRRGLASFFAVPTRMLPPAPPKMVPTTRMYAAARQSRLTAWFGSSGNASADAELHSSLQMLRARSRQMIRDSAYAKRARLLVQNNVVGAGIDVQAQVMTESGDLRKAVNDAIEAGWGAWCAADACHTGGALHFADMERLLIGQVFDAGEVLVRAHRVSLGRSRVPMALEVVEPERLAEDYMRFDGVTPGAFLVMGVEQDAFGRALAYWVRRGHPGDLRERERADRYERVPADEMFHLRLIDRWPQSRGEPWLHATLRKLDDMNEYTASELAAARAASMYFGTIETNDPDNPLGTTAGTGEAARPEMHIEPLAIEQLGSGEKFSFHSPNRPNTALDPFMRYMLREISAGVGPSYESLSRDYSQSNYSSSRLALLDDRDLWRVLQQWWVRSFRQPLHRLWLQRAMEAEAIGAVAPAEYWLRPAKFEAAIFKCRGWQWIDPAREVESYKEAVRAGFTTVSDVIRQTAGGLDIEDVIATRKRELEMFEQAGIDVDTTVEETKEPEEAVSPDDPPQGDDERQKTARHERVVSLRR